MYLADQFPGPGDLGEEWVSVYEETAAVWEESMATSPDAMDQFRANYG